MRQRIIADGRHVDDVIEEAVCISIGEDRRVRIDASDDSGLLEALRARCDGDFDTGWNGRCYWGTSDSGDVWSILIPFKSKGATGWSELR